MFCVPECAEGNVLDEVPPQVQNAEDGQRINHKTHVSYATKNIKINQ